MSVKIGFYTAYQLPWSPASSFLWWGCDCDWYDCDVVKTKLTPSLLPKDLVNITNWYCCRNKNQSLLLVYSRSLYFESLNIVIIDIINILCF